MRTGHRGRPKKQYLADQAFGAQPQTDDAFIAEVPIEKAMSGSSCQEWLEAIVSKMRDIIRNETWTLTTKPIDCKVIGNQIVLRNKYGRDDTIERRKARVIAKGFSQRPGIDFKDSFAPWLISIPSEPCSRLPRKMKCRGTSINTLTHEEIKTLVLNIKKCFNKKLEKTINSFSEFIIGAARARPHKATAHENLSFSENR